MLTGEGQATHFRLMADQLWLMLLIEAVGRAAGRASRETERI